MANGQCELLSPWFEETDPEDGHVFRRPLVTTEFKLARWTDITGQPAANLPSVVNLVALLVEADESVIDAIKADPRFRVLWEASRGTLQGSRIDSGWFTDLSAWLAGKGATTLQVRGAIGTAPQGRTVGEIGAALREALRQFPKAARARD